ncbi:hypothetical protein V6Z11_A03G178900 [Gossypium hirsutum]
MKGLLGQRRGERQAFCHFGEMVADMVHQASGNVHATEARRGRRS